MLQSCKLAIKSIAANKMRSFLTMLGIIIGVASVIILVSLVNAYMSYVTQSFARMGANQMTVTLRNQPSRSVTEDEMYAFLEANADVFDYISPTVSVSGSVRYQTDTMDYTGVTGVSEDYLDIKDYTIEIGRNIQYSDIVGRQKVALIGYFTATELFGTPAAAIGQQLKLGDSYFTVEGVVAAQDEDNLEAGGTDDFVWIPYSTASKMSRNANMGSYIMAAKSPDEVAAAKSALEDFLEEELKSSSLYRITAMGEMLDQLNTMIAMLSAGLGGIAGISLLVAGVGVMNIMLVSVTERTREIGIRKALGAKRGVILQQFIIEAATTSMLGGLVGIVIGGAATSAVGALSDLPATPTPMAVAVSFAVSVCIGVFFGFAPANKAAKLNPIDALRSE
ncbi:MAG: ABC transporter permease [Lachnospiraceae bacterium]|jgi:putative ABC transport system permease protein|nr:ABC transporter permease [Lachnospiraceae bacterium]